MVRDPSTLAKPEIISPSFFHDEVPVKEIDNLANWIASNRSSQNSRSYVGYRDFHICWLKNPSQQICLSQKLKPLSVSKSIYKVGQQHKDYYVDDIKNLQFRRPALRLNQEPNFRRN
jgi:hypothetical protein